MKIRIEPTKKQQEFIASDADILMFAGGAGSGKSFILILDALGLNAKEGPRILLPHYRAMIIRKEYSHLSDLIDKSKELYKLICPEAVFNNSELFWTFPSGAKIQFFYLNSYADCDKIQGKEFQYIAIDELGQYTDERVFKYCLSRLRSSYNIKCYLRATSNPSRYKWLKDFFRIGPLGESTNFVETFGNKKLRIKYIRATLLDNPYLGEDYKAMLQMLPEDDRNALLYGDWNAYNKVTGSVYGKEIDKLYAENRYCNIPVQRGYDIYASFDIGRNDNTSIILFQLVGKEIHIVESFENRFEDITFYIDALKKKGFEDAHIILPHDSKMHRIETKNSVFETISEHFSKVTVLDRTSIEEGIDKARQKFQNVYIDKNKNLRLIECLTNYRRKFNETLNTYGDVVHDEFSNFADSFRYLCVFEKSEPVKIDIDKMLNFAYTL